MLRAMQSSLLVMLCSPPDDYKWDIAHLLIDIYSVRSVCHSDGIEILAAVLLLHVVHGKEPFNVTILGLIELHIYESLA